MNIIGTMESFVGDNGVLVVGGGGTDAPGTMDPTDAVRAASVPTVPRGDSLLEPLDAVLDAAPFFAVVRLPLLDSLRIAVPMRNVSLVPGVSGRAFGGGGTLGFGTTSCGDDGAGTASALPPLVAFSIIPVAVFSSSSAAAYVVPIFANRVLVGSRTTMTGVIG